MKLSILKGMGFRLLFVVSFSVLMLAQPIAGISQDKGTLAGASAPNFALKDLNGKLVHLSDFKGKVVILNFWTTWCGYCRLEMPSLERLQEQMYEHELVILAVSEDTSESDIVKAFIEKSEYSFKVILDPTQTLLDSYLVPGYPTTYIINKDGVVVERSIGAEEWDSQKRLEQLKALSPKSSSPRILTKKEDENNIKVDVIKKDSRIRDFIGTWVNEDPYTGGVTRIEMRSKRDLVYAHVWGKCHPYDCDWGEEVVDYSHVSDGIIKIDWDHGFAERTQKLTILDDDRLKLEEHTHFKDDSGRKDYDSLDYFGKRK